MTLGCIFSSWEVRTYCPIAQTELSITISSNIIYWNGIANKDILRGTNNLTLICTQLVFWLKSNLGVWSLSLETIHYNPNQIHRWYYCILLNIF